MENLPSASPLAPRPSYHPKWSSQPFGLSTSKRTIRNKANRRTSTSLRSEGPMYIYKPSHRKLLLDSTTTKSNKLAPTGRDLIESSAPSEMVLTSWPQHIARCYLGLGTF
ncbi:hypothetical protein BHM03_00001934 [Ensete ventricosum]|uniref:Uncharacterized protein n=1 Tax=Ensete ventricosum TaxID=4639 RepID=A0A445M9D7_ENSVE|nr:hypothetical protein BHM03_00001934 [Ensete ventricosum]